MRRIIVLGIVLIMLLLKKAYGINFKNDSIADLTISGKITFDRERRNDVYKVELIKNNKVIDSIEVRDKHSFKFKLSKNEYYGIRVSKKGFISKLISVDTDVKEENLSKRRHHFHFGTKLLSETKLDKLNKDALDFPIAVISFNKKKESFSYSKKYTAEIKRRMYFKDNDWS